MARKRKTLAELVRDGSFLTRRHEQLLDGDLVDDDELAELQAAWQLESDSWRRRKVALRFERACRDGAGDRSASTREALEGHLLELGPPRSPERRSGIWPRFFRLEDGSPWTLDDWQLRFQGELHSRDADGRRVYKIAGLGVPRGNAKTPFATGEGISELIDPPAKLVPRVFQIAGSGDQAVLGTEYAESWIVGDEDDPGELSQWLQIRAGRVKHGRGTYKAMKTSGSLLHGRRPTVAIADELWAFEQKAQVDSYVALETALPKNPESYLLWISTAGWDKDGLLGRRLAEAVTFPDVSYERDGFLMVARDVEQGRLVHWYGAPEDLSLDELTDPELLTVAKLCNPGSWIDHRGIVQAYRRADDKLDAARFLFNQWTAVKGAWLPAGVWRKLKGDETPSMPPPGTRIWVAVDSALTHDCTAVAWAWHEAGERVAVKTQVWAPQAIAVAHDHVASPTDNEALVEPWIHGLADEHGLRIDSVVYDPNRFQTEAKHLAERFLVAEMYPSSKPMHAAVQEFYKACTGGRITHDGDPVLQSHVESIAGERSEDGWRIRKLSQTRRIDGGVAAIMAHSQALIGNSEGWVLRR